MSTFKVSSRVAAALACLALVAVPASAEAGKNTIRSVHSKDASGATRILIKGTSTPTFTVYKLDRPARVIVDIAGSELATSLDRTGEGKAVWKLNSWAVGDMTAHPLARNGASVVRFVVGMARPGRYDVKAVGNDVLITVTARDKPPVAGDAAARAQAERARAEAERARTAAAAAEKRAEKQIAAARAEAARARAALKRAQKRADEQVDAARADARKAIAEAEKRAEQAKRRLAAASAKMAEADRRLDEVKALRQRAEKAESRAKAALSAAASARAEAASADERAAKRRAEAEKAAEAAERYRAQAAAAAGDSKKAAALRKRAERAARDAEERRAKAEKAAEIAEARRAAAERAAGEAEKRKTVAQAAVAEAKAERARADGAKRRAEAERARAEAERAAADKRRQLAESAAAEAKRRAAAARELREKEELALRRAAAARELAEKRKAEAERARAALVASVADARKAKQLADSRRNQVDAARKRVASQTDARARARAAADLKKYETQLAAAEAELAKHNREVAGKRRQVAALDAKRDKAAAELRQLRAAADSARAAREGEESKLAELIKRRADEEKQLASARKAREEAEKRAAEAEKRAAAAERRAAQAAQKAKTSAKRVAKRAPKVRIRKVGFDDGRDSSKVTIALSAPTKPRIVDADGRRQILEFTDATIARSLERTLDTSKYRGPVKAVSSYRSRKNPGVVRVVVDLDGTTKSRLRRVGNDYHWEFAKSARTAKRSARAKPRKTARASRIPAPVVGGYGSTSTPIAQQTVAQVSNGRRVYRGTKIDLDFKDADIHNLLRLLADVGGVNIVIPDEIKYRVTVRMRRVPWDQALEVILASKGLWYERNGNLYRIAPRKELDAEAQAEAERRAAMVQQEVPQPEYITLNYAVASDVQDQVRQMLSPKGSMQVDERTNTIVVIDVRANRRNIANLLARLDTPTPQIQIEARIVEARSTFNREIGVQWGGSAISSAATGNATGLIFPNSVAVRGGGEDNQTNATGVATPSDFAVNLPAAVGSGAGGALGFSLGSVGGNFNLSLRLSALEDQGTVRIVSSPKITVVNNVEAKISQGVSIPISVVSANGVQTQFVPADLELTVTPTVSQRDCAITMDINVKKNEADFVNTGARGDPTILRKEAKTRVLVADGATTVIGGVYTRNTGLSYSKVPFFADLPVIGWFFKKRQENDERSEILVFITPKITNKASLRCE